MSLIAYAIIAMNFSFVIQMSVFLRQVWFSQHKDYVWDSNVPLFQCYGGRAMLIM